MGAISGSGHFVGVNILLLIASSNMLVLVLVVTSISITYLSLHSARYTVTIVFEGTSHLLSTRRPKKRVNVESGSSLRALPASISPARAL